jgi:uncharacterized membrane protein YhaH (DUF805 family)
MRWILMPFQRLTDFSGRSRRMEFWLFWLTALILQMVTSYIDAVTSQPLIAGGMGSITLAVTLILLAPAATVGIRRLHDIGRSGWWMLLFGLPYLGWLVSVDSGSQSVIAALALLVGTIILLVLLVQPGTPADNAYGPNPKGGATNVKA